ncbi:hypothetical protein [Ancylobacter sp.]|uniref:hypothetical protein n=1 Tax=Ancylobacter sp. TaxID=1872567 RepID=UPI003D0E5BBC
MEIAAKTLPAVEFAVSDAEVDRAVAACEGDLRATVRALLVGQVYMQAAMQKKVSAGYVRRLPFARLDAVQGK